MNKNVSKILGILAAISLVLSGSSTLSLAGSFLDVAKQTGVEIARVGNALIWKGPAAGVTKPQGPLVGKKVGIIAASEFSDFQAYYLYSYIGEFGGKLEFLPVDWVKFKFTRPQIKDKGVRGMWDLPIDPFPFRPGKWTSKKLSEANPKDYQALIVLGGHSADVMVAEDKVINFIKEAYANGAVLGAIGAGSMPYIRAGLMDGKKATGDAQVEFMIRKIGTFVPKSVVTDGKLITAGDTVDTPAFVRELCKAFDPKFQDPRKGAMAGKRILIIAGEDFEDIEIAVPVMEFLFRGATVTLATFPPPLQARPGMVGLNVVQGNFGMTVPLQEIPLTHYKIKPLSQVSLDEFDVLMIPGGFCPWNMVQAREPIGFLKKADAAGKILAYICNGPTAVAAADLVKGKKIAGWRSCHDPITIMGGEYSWEWAATIDGKHVTGRTPPDVPEFMDAINIALEME